MNFTTELLISELKTAKENYVHLGRSIEKNWNDLQRLRIEQGYASRNLAVQKTEQRLSHSFYFIFEFIYFSLYFIVNFEFLTRIAQ